jgi:hypothetical protein
VLEESYAAAAEDVLGDVREGSSDIGTYAQELVRRFNAASPSQEVALLGENLGTLEDRAQFIARALAIRNIPARVLHGMSLGEPKSFQQLSPFLQVHNGQGWVVMDIATAEEGLPENFFLWTRSPRDLLVVESDKRPKVEFAVQRNLADAVAIATRRTEVRSENLVKYSLLGLPVEMQGVYKILLTGADRRLHHAAAAQPVIGIKTFGTFMPVLIALAFRETKICRRDPVLAGSEPGPAGALLPGAAAPVAGAAPDRVLILVVLLMAWSACSNQLGHRSRPVVALFPMVIMTMTIERMSVAWEERGPGTAIKEALGSLIVASLAYLAMGLPRAASTWSSCSRNCCWCCSRCTLLLGRYSGYRLSELFRFRALARDPEAADRRAAAGRADAAGSLTWAMLQPVRDRQAPAPDRPDRDRPAQRRVRAALQPAQVLSARRRQAHHQEAWRSKAGLPVPELYAVVREEHEIEELHEKIKDRESFVVKPAHGSGRRRHPRDHRPPRRQVPPLATAHLMTRDEFEPSFVEHAVGPVLAWAGSRTTC